MIQSKEDLKRYLEADARKFNGRMPNFMDRLVHSENWYINKLVRHLRYVEYYKNVRPLAL